MKLSKVKRAFVWWLFFLVTSSPISPRKWTKVPLSKIQMYILKPLSDFLGYPRFECETMEYKSKRLMNYNKSLKCRIIQCFWLKKRIQWLQKGEFQSKIIKRAFQPIDSLLRVYPTRRFDLFMTLNPSIEALLGNLLSVLKVLFICMKKKLLIKVFKSKKNTHYRCLCFRTKVHEYRMYQYP